jgi:hypothetical protein
VVPGDLSLAITFDYAHAPVTAPPGIRQRYRVNNPIMVVLPEAHPLAGSAAVDPSDMQPTEWITTKSGRSTPPGVRRRGR